VSDRPPMQAPFLTPATFADWLADPHRRPAVMGVLNVTPDSFSDGGRFADAAAAVAAAAAMVEAGADVIDIGGESTRPGSQPVPAAEQIRRVVPVVEGIRAKAPDATLSIDTTRAAVAEAALDAGATLLNDVSAGRDDADMLPLAARRGCPIVLMHMLGTPATMQAAPAYDDVTAEVAAFLSDRAAAAVAAGVSRTNVLLDPGIGFGKTIDHNLELLRRLRELADLGYPLVVGTSRKKFVGVITDEPEPSRRVFGTAATVAWSVANGAAMVRVHDVGPMAQVVRMTRAVIAGRWTGAAR
jgi:dihydropteroate synthase